MDDPKVEFAVMGTCPDEGVSPPKETSAAVRESGLPAGRYFVGSKEFNLREIAHYHMSLGQLCHEVGYRWCIHAPDPEAVPDPDGKQRAIAPDINFSSLALLPYDNSVFPILKKFRLVAEEILTSLELKIEGAYHETFGAIYIGRQFAATLGLERAANERWEGALHLVTWNVVWNEFVQPPESKVQGVTWGTPSVSADVKEPSTRVGGFYTYPLRLPNGTVGWEKSKIALYPKQLADLLLYNYTDAVARKTARLAEMIANKDLSGGKVVVLRGPAGTGKTHLLGALLLLLHDHLGHYPLIVSSPTEFVKQPVYALIQQISSEPAAIVLEDSGNLVSSDLTVRPEDMASVIFNITDGRISTTRNDLFIFTFNDQTRVDPAFLRPGRCLASIEVGPLDPEAQERFFLHHGRKELAGSSSRTLAECYELLRENPDIDRRNTTGFKP